MLGMLGAGFSVVLLALLVLAFKPFPLAAESGAVAIFAGGVPLVLGLAMFQYGLAGKFRTRQAMLNLISWRGDEHVLDVGTGAGLLLVGAAKRLHRGGSAVGIDVWSGKDLSDNSEAAAQRNITLEGVANRASIQTADAVQMPFANGSFDCVLSLLCIHNIEPKADQTKACQEIARVLKPGGRIVIGDYIPTSAYAAAFSAAGLVVERSRPAFGVAGALMWLLVADKPLKREE